MIAAFRTFLKRKFPKSLEKDFAPERLAQGSRQRSATGETTAFVAVDGARVVGYICISASARGLGSLGVVGVDPAYFGRRVGDRIAVLVGLALMLVGGAIVLLEPSWFGQIIGRLIAGTGGILLNVLMTKMVADWFAGHEIATAMAVFINSWPCGIAVSLLVLPAIGATYGLFTVNVVVLSTVNLAALLFAGLPE